MLREENGSRRRSQERWPKITSKRFFASEDVGVSWQGWSGGGPTISQEQNEELLKEVTEDEVSKAVFEINPSKCPEPDGMTGFFYQHF